MSGRRGAALRVGGALGVLAVTTAIARTRGVDQVERRVFRSLNDLPHALHPPVYVVMQAGSLAAVYVAAAAAHRLGRGRLAWTIAAGGTGVWGAAKVVKRWVGRGRPADHVDDVRVRGDEEGGLGFPSGHTAVAFCLATLAAPDLPPRLRPLVWAAAGTVGAARVYVGAHLPLDVVGGAALGVVAGSAGRRLAHGSSRQGG